MSLVRWVNYIRATALLLAAPLFAVSSRPCDTVLLARVPDGGIQPQAAVDEHGTVHLVYFSGDPMAGDLFYAHSNDGGATFSKALSVNSTKGSAVAVGNIRGAHIAIGRSGRVHVAWNGSKNTLLGPQRTVPMLYTRLNDSGTAFEPERNVIRSEFGLDGGGAIAADRMGDVYVFWHAPERGTEGEGNRRVWVAHSQDDGYTFEPERPATQERTGACGCCGMAATADSTGGVFALYRSARDVFNRDMYLLRSGDRGFTFGMARIDEWKVGYCVMSSASFASAGGLTFAAWETRGQIHFGRVAAGADGVSRILAAPGSASGCKHPVIAVDKDGRVLLAWTEDMGWKKGGSAAWQVFDSDGNLTDCSGHVDGVPAWSLIAAFARPRGGFTLLY